VKDNGPGIAENDKKAAPNGIGLTNTLERLEKLYGDEHKFSMQNVNGGGLRVAVEIPFRLA